MHISAYEHGLRDGRTDRFLGCANGYAMAGLIDPPWSYGYQYARGYHLGLAGRG